MGDAADDAYDAAMRELMNFTDIYGRRYHVDPKLRRQLRDVDRAYSLQQLRELVEAHGVFLKFRSRIASRRRSD